MLYSLGIFPGRYSGCRWLHPRELLDHPSGKRRRSSRPANRIAYTPQQRGCRAQNRHTRCGFLTNWGCILPHGTTSRRPRTLCTSCRDLHPPLSRQNAAILAYSQQLHLFESNRSLLISYPFYRDSISLKPEPWKRHPVLEMSLYPYRNTLGFPVSSVEQPMLRKRNLTI